MSIQTAHQRYFQQWFAAPSRNSEAYPFLLANPTQTAASLQTSLDLTNPQHYRESLHLLHDLGEVAVVLLPLLQSHLNHPMPRWLRRPLTASVRRLQALPTPQPQHTPSRTRSKHTKSRRKTRRAIPSTQQLYAQAIDEHLGTSRLISTDLSAGWIGALPLFCQGDGFYDPGEFEESGYEPYYDWRRGEEDWRLFQSLAQLRQCCPWLETKHNMSHEMLDTQALLLLLSALEEMEASYNGWWKFRDTHWTLLESALWHLPQTLPEALEQRFSAVVGALLHLMQEEESDLPQQACRAALHTLHQQLTHERRLHIQALCEAQLFHAA